MNDAVNTVMGTDHIPAEKRRAASPEMSTTLPLLDFGAALVSAFDHVSDVYVFVKDADRRFVACSIPFAKLLGYRHPQQILGLRDEDLSPEYLADHYRSHDKHIMEHGEQLINLVELVRNVNGTYDWYLTTKAPVFGEAGTPIGIVGHTRGLTKRNVQSASLLVMTPAVELISRDFGRQLTIEELASSVSMSSSNFTRSFREHFGVSPHKYLLRIRIMAACDLLSTTDLRMAEIAEQTGFYDQSHLARSFREQRGIAAKDYRKQFRDAPGLRGGARISLSGASESSLQID